MRRVAWPGGGMVWPRGAVSAVTWPFVASSVTGVRALTPIVSARVGLSSRPGVTAKAVAVACRLERESQGWYS